MGTLLRSGTTWIVAVGIVLIVALALLVVNERTDAFDQAIISLVRQPALDALRSPLGLITELGSTGAVTAVAVITVLVGVMIGPWRHGLAGAITIGLASIGNEALKTTIARGRPELLGPIVVERGFSFPSGHSALSMVAYGALAVLISRSRLPAGVRLATTAALAVLIFLIGVSRIWLGVHYPTDVLAGWTAGAVIVLVYARVTRRVSPEPAAAMVDAGPAAPRSDRPAPH